MSTSVGAITEKFSQLVKAVRGDLVTQVDGMATPQQAKSHQLVCIPDPKHLAQAQTGDSLIWLVHPELLELVPAKVKVVLTSSQIQLAMAQIGREFFRPQANLTPFGGTPVHPTAVIDPSAELAEGVIVGPHTTIGPRTRLGRHAIVGANTTIEADCLVGERTHIHPQVFIAHGTHIGADCEIQPQTSIGTEGFGFAHDSQGRHFRITHFGRVVIESKVQIGAGVQIDRGTFEDSQIGEGTIIDNHCHFGHNIRIGKGCVFVGGVIVAGSVTIGNHCVFGGRITIAGHLTIVDGCQFAGLTGIPSSITKPGKYGGYPPQPLNEALKISASMVHLPRLRKNVALLLKHLGLRPEEN